MDNMDMILLLFPIQALVSGSLAYSNSDEGTLRTNLIKVSTYDRLARPDELTTVTIGISILAVNDLDIKSQQFSATGWLTVTWTDSRITWDHTSFSNTEYIHALPTEIWYPELFIDNSNNEFERVGQSDLILRTKYTGEVHWEPPVLFEVYCNIDVTYYPFDRQKCAIEILSWGLPKTELALKLDNTEVNFREYSENGQWAIVGSSATLSYVTEDAHGETEVYGQVIYEIKMRRRVDFYVINTIFPIVLTSFLIVIAFIVPSECGEKLSFSFTVLLTVAVLLTLYIGDLPDISTTTSILAMYLAFTLFFATLATLLTTFILIFHHRENNVPMSPFHRKLLGAIMCCIRWKPQTRKNQVKDDVGDDDDDWGFQSSSTNNNNNVVNPSPVSARTQFMTRNPPFTPVRRSPSNMVTPAAASGSSEQANSTTMVIGIGGQKRDVYSADSRKRTGNDAISWQETALIWDRFAFIVGMILTSLYNVIFITVMAVGGYYQSS